MVMMYRVYLWFWIWISWQAGNLAWDWSRIDFPSYWRGSRSSRSRNKCASYPSVDCFTQGFMTDKKGCNSFGCKWCPKPFGSKEPWCVTGEERPAECKISPAVDCFEAGSQITKRMCDKAKCHWCPKKRGPWCVKGFPDLTEVEPKENLKTQNQATISYSDCGRGTTFRYKDATACCTMAEAYSCGTLLPEERILGGYLSTRGSWPWLIHFVPYGDAVCSAVLIGPIHAITAGHCVYGASAKRMSFSLGIINSWRPSTSHLKRASAKKTWIHPEFGYSPRLVKDIAIIEFKKPLTFGGSINAICLPETEDPPVGSKCYIAGWGATVFNGYASDEMREANVYILESDICQHAYGPTYDRKRMICAGHLDGKADSCLGDSGGPLMCQRCTSCQWYVAGLVSYGKGCGMPGYPGVYTRVSAYEDWLKERDVISRVGTSTSCDLHQLT